MGKNVKRLFSDFQPSHYSLSLTPDAKAMQFSGSVVIKGRKTSRPSQRLTFHQNGLKITKATITKHDKKGPISLEVVRINSHQRFNEVRLHTKDPVYPSEYTVTLEFSGTITKPMNGLYPCFYKQGKQEKVILATQFESHHAREVFPCIDEPEAKATFDLAITAPAGETVLSNTPVKTSKTTGNLTTTVFETTPVMSSYLLAFIIGDIKHKEAHTKGGTLVRAWATPENVDYVDFALDVGVKCLEFYNEYFAIPYPLEKCDMIALPDFASGAMENWGCITYREHCMLVEPGTTSLHTKQYVAMVVAHELAHQWFGNLVTMRWWTDLWLNEGFASWIEYMAVDHLFPEWQMWTQFITDEQQHALKLDALENTHPIEVAITHPDEIRTIFDTISYAKGASVIHMLHGYLGPEAFRDGLRYYLKSHAHGNTDTTDLWEALEKVSGKPVKDFMHAWTALPGYPLVSVNVEETTVTASQERFLVIKPKAAPSVDWPVPLLANTETGHETITKDISFELSDTTHLLLNSGRSGFYRTVYNASHTHRLGELVQRGKLSSLDRLGLLSDSFEAVKAGYANTDDALGLLANYAQESDNAVWDIISTNLADMRVTMDSDELRAAMKPYVRDLVANQLERLGWKARKDEPYFDSLLRPTILGMASLAEHQPTVDHALKLFKSMHDADDVAADLRDGGSRHEVQGGLIDPEIRGVVYGTVARQGSQADFDKLWQMHEATSSSEERLNLCAALTGFKQPAIIKKVLSLITTDSIRLQDASYWIAYSFMNRHAKTLTWQWLQDNWQWLEKNMGTDLSFSRFPIYAARGHSDPAFIQEYTAFFSKVMTPTLERSYKQGLEMITWRSAWKQRDYETILQFFTAKEPKA